MYTEMRVVAGAHNPERVTRYQANVMGVSAFTEQFIFRHILELLGHGFPRENRFFTMSMSAFAIQDIKKEN